MNKYIDIIIGNEAKTTKDFDFNISNSISKSKYTYEIEGFINYIFYYTVLNKDITRLYVFNGDLICFSEQMLKYMRTLLDLSISYKDTDSKLTISYIICSIFKSYGKEPYKNHSNIRETRELFSKYFPIREVVANGVIFNMCVCFSKNTITQVSKFEHDRIYHYNLLIDCIDFIAKNSIDSTKYISHLISMKHSHLINYLYHYDNNICSNLEIYFSHQLDLIMYARDFRILEFLLKKDLVTVEHEHRILSVLNQQLAAPPIDFIRKIHSYECIIKATSKIITLKISDNFKQKLHKINKKALSQKRVETINPEKFTPHSHSEKLEVPEEVVRDFYDRCDANMLEAIASSCLLQFEESIPTSIQIVCDAPLLHLVDKMSTTEEGLIIRSPESPEDNSIVNYYTKQVLNYINKSADDLRNFSLLESHKLYGYLMEYASFSSSFTCSLTGLWLIQKYGEKYYLEIISNYKADDTFNNPQIFLFDLVLSIELLLTDIYNILYEEKINSFDISLVSKIFKKLKIKKSNMLKADVVTYINFVLFDTLGLNLRNKLAHGSLKCGSYCDVTFLSIVTAHVMCISMKQELNKNENGDET